MRKFFALLRIQLLARYADLKPSNLKNITDKKEKKKKQSTLLAYVLVAVMFGAMIVPFEYFMLEALAVLQMETLLPALAVTLSMVCTLIMSFFFIMTSLYFGKDAAYLAALPLKSSTVLSAKLTQVWLSETMISTLFIFPATILYGIKVGADWTLYLRMIPVWLTVSILPICIVTFLSALLIRLSALWKHREAMMTVGGMVLMMAYFVFIFAINTQPMDEMESMAGMIQLLTNNKALLQGITYLFPPAVWAAEGLLGNWGSLALSVMVSCAAVVFTVWAMAKPYRRLSLLQTQVPENKKEFKGDRHFSASTPFMACFRRELRQLTRISTYALNTFPTAIMPAFFIGVMGTALFSEIPEGESLRAALDMTGLNVDIIATGILLLMMGFMAGINPAVSTAVSREGRGGHGMLTSLPVDPKVYARAKLAVGMLLSFAGVALAGVIGCVLIPDFAAAIILACVLCCLYCYATNAISLCMDIKKPRLDWMTETEAIKQGTNVLKGMLLSLLMLVVLLGAGVGLFFLEVSFPVFALSLIVLMVLACWVSRGLMLRTAEKYYWQD